MTAVAAAASACRGASVEPTAGWLACARCCDPSGGQRQLPIGGLAGCLTARATGDQRRPSWEQHGDSRTGDGGGSFAACRDASSCRRARRTAYFWGSFAETSRGLSAGPRPSYAGSPHLRLRKRAMKSFRPAHRRRTVLQDLRERPAGHRRCRAARVGLRLWAPLLRLVGHPHPRTPGDQR